MRRALAAACLCVLALASTVHATKSTIRWTIPTNGPCTAPAVHYRANQEAIVIVSCSDGSLSAVSGSNGTTIWTAKLVGAAATDPTVTQDGYVYVAAATGLVACYSAETGIRRWGMQTPHGIAQRSPLSVCDNRVFIGTDNGNVVSFDATTGVWEWTDTTSYVTDPAPLCANGVVAFSLYGNVMADDIHTKQTAWVSDYANPSTSFFRAPMALGERLYFPFSGGWVYVFEGATGKFLFLLDVPTLMQLGEAHGDVLVTSEGGHLVAYDGFADHGKQLWNATQASFSSPAAPWQAQPVRPIAFVGTGDGLLAVNTTSGKTVASVQTNTPVTRRPIADHYRAGLVYVATQEAVYAACILQNEVLGGCAS